ncbi:MAG TPA: bifunctional (p)ppGpp synthetase/guanosine-3',5'-bis(diphosphate) 3'-pyrophosphohydrolase [Bacteroidales bacterium]|nr:bifunctional (p)ppGpp synthetase/guanosine-3',5'-bis(diphosphate) 3'-pyrophosphohydrolase [Bacteroidales bacterium]HOU94998.1 bifunctional (p)ppGpp synthetase/guanosine-3',5'-bis(diphosphate) 3'-pyrophosphohydrolase [Bacteroidales bacterium]HQG35699.1 bifunctional (p)ppGpp synthetase/guanosine-3',5'-bis(diphosphate) 3'-pyrophosphohydrolase [Bacteroidales bacterium]HQJ19753.1 bifunctional (p)ppGpp synthetase/guanosine-3',5'-bis(diphosphate) 3'-pyrophosphohydrolase [Bacteroidales bacterium]
MSNKDIFDEDDKKLITAEYESLINNLQKCKKPGDRELIEKAFNTANEAHWNMRRKSGEPYIIHPIQVAKIVNQEIGLGATSVSTALLHDIVEDTDYKLDDVRRDFGDKIASLIDGLTKISNIYSKDSTTSLQAANFRKMMLTISDDLRVILIKIADRLHNMRTLDSLPEHKKMKVAGETIYIYAPLADRLGLYSIKTELEDLSFKFRQPRIYDEIRAKLIQDEKKNYAFINKFSLPIIEKLNEAGYKFEITGRPKSIYSIWKKMQKKNVPFEEIYDVFAVRIVFEPLPGISEKTQCWNIYSLITDIYLPKPDRLRDWLSRPKPNGYEALHVTVMGPEGKWVEVQIRSTRMDEIAEHGYAAHWKYKGDDPHETEFDKWVKKIRVMLENPLEDPAEFIDDFKLNLFSNEIIVFTPKGLLISLPKGSTALDFAYEIHSEVGDKAIGAKINYNLMPLNTELQSGDQVEIITSDKAQPEKEWLNWVHTPRAKSAIKNSLKAISKDRIQKGMVKLEGKLNEIGLTPSSEILKKIMKEYDISNKEELYSKIGLDLIPLDNLKKIIRKNPDKNIIQYWGLKLTGAKKEKPEEESSKPLYNKDKPFLLRENIETPEQSYEIAKCCNPIPGDDVVGYMSPEGTIIVHKPKCPVAIRLMSSEGNRIIAVKWTIHKIRSFPVRLKITGFDRIGLLNDITKIISNELKVNIRNINITVNEGIFEGTIDLYVHHTRDINNLITKISNINGIQSVVRIEEFPE